MNIICKLTLITSIALFSPTALVLPQTIQLRPLARMPLSLNSMKAMPVFITAKSLKASRRRLDAETAQAQHPFAIVVGCVDSRTSPEIIFGQSNACIALPRLTFI
ncbi:MAG: hypothetical protein DME75_09045 [Verrucomicrobia bacterium]|nr:MAG: hypothetical protein DME75_09045 [Verrucomicrobiota bacterium]